MLALLVIFSLLLLLLEYDQLLLLKATYGGTQLIIGFS